MTPASSVAPLTLTFSGDQAATCDALAAQLRGVGVDIDDASLSPAVEGKATVLTVMDKAGRKPLVPSSAD